MQWCPISGYHRTQQAFYGWLKSSPVKSPFYISLGVFFVYAPLVLGNILDYKVQTWSVLSIDKYKSGKPVLYNYCLVNGVIILRCFCFSQRLFWIKFCTLSGLHTGEGRPKAVTHSHKNCSWPRTRRVAARNRMRFVCMIASVFLFVCGSLCVFFSSRMVGFMRKLIR